MHVILLNVVQNHTQLRENSSVF